MRSLTKLGGRVAMTNRLTDDRLTAPGETVCKVAAELTAALGGVMPVAKSA